MKKIEPINIMNKFSLFNEQWTPKIIGELNGQHVKICKLKDNFVWHSHENEDELFMVFKGTLLIDFRDGRTIHIKDCLLYTSPSPRDATLSRMPSSA